MVRGVDFKTVNNLLICDLRGILRWRVTGKIAGTADKTGRITIGIKYKKYHATDIVWLLTFGVWPVMRLDHKDTNPGNNDPSNLREASRMQNSGNRGAAKHNKLGIKGVSKANSRSGYCARITINGKYTHLGTFCTIDAAHVAYVQAAKKHFGEFARG